MTVLHLDMDSFFATVEQQAWPHLRGKAVGISLAPTPGGTIVAASREAKLRGVGTGTKVGEARSLIPDIVLLKPQPEKYRAVHRRFRAIMADYPGTLKPRSIDEIALWLDDKRLDNRPPLAIGAEIKQRVRDEVGEWLSSSVGIGPNWLLAKTASNLEKPDGLVQITPENIRDTLGQLKLRDLCGIARRMEARLNLAGYATPLDVYDADPWELKRRLGMVGYYWHRRLHGTGIDTEQWATKSIGHSSVIPRPADGVASLKPLLHKLCERTGRRLRAGRWEAGAVGVGGQLAGDSLPGRGWWWQNRAVAGFNRSDTLFDYAWEMLRRSRPPGPLRVLAVRTSRLQALDPEQPSLFSVDRRARQLTDSLDQINDRWGEHTVQPAAMLGLDDRANDSIAFGQDMTTRQEWTG